MAMFRRFFLDIPQKKLKLFLQASLERFRQTNLIQAMLFVKSIVFSKIY